MAYNASFFVDTIPDDFDSWDQGTKVEYYNDYLWGFSLLVSNTTQWWIAENLVQTDIQQIWEWIQDPGNTFDSGYNATMQFLEYLMDPESIPTPTTAEDPCDYTQRLDADFYILYLAPAVFVALLFSFFKKRRQLCRDCCWGRPSLAYPINFVDEHSRRWAFAAAFLITIHRVIILLADGVYIWKPDEFDDPLWMKTYGWTKMFVGFLNVVVICSVFYPLIAALAYRHHILANIIGIACVAPFVWTISVLWQLCPVVRGGETDVKGVLQALFDVPRLICFFLLLVAYVWDLIKNIIKLARKPIQHKSQQKEEPLPIQYLRHLLKKRPKEPPTSFVQRLKRCCTYENVPGFRYSSRIYCTMLVAAFALYKIAIELQTLVSVVIIPLAWYLVDETDEVTQLIPQNYTWVLAVVREGLVASEYSFIVCNLLSLLLHIVFIIHMIITYRQHMLKMYSGNRRWHFKYAGSPSSDMVAGMRYSGYQIAYLFYGYFILLMVLLLISLVITFGIVLPLKLGYASIIIEKIIELWPTILLSLGLYFVQVLLAKFLFLQNRGASMALNNRRLYHIVSYYLFFANILLGIFSCLKRVLMSLVFGVIFVSRLDRNLMMRGVERFDSGFKAYLGFLVVDLNHNHPVMKAFILLLQDEVQVGKKYRTEKHTEFQVQIVENNKVQPVPEKKTYMWRNKWRKAVTLINNPILVVESLQEQVKESQKNWNTNVADEVFNQMANIGTVVVGGGLVAVGDGIHDITPL